MYSTIAMTCATVALAVTVGIAVAVKNGTPYIVLDETSDWEVVWSVHTPHMHHHFACSLLHQHKPRIHPPQSPYQHQPNDITRRSIMTTATHHFKLQQQCSIIFTHSSNLCDQATMRQPLPSCRKHTQTITSSKGQSDTSTPTSATYRHPQTFAP